MASDSLLPAALELLADLLQSTEAEDFLRAVQPDQLRRDLMLYRQELRMMIRRLTDNDMAEISEAFPERLAELLALIGDINGYIEDSGDAARLGVAMAKVGRILAESAGSIGITLPTTIFLEASTTPLAVRWPDQGQRKVHGALHRIKELLFGLLEVAKSIVFPKDTLMGIPVGFDTPDDFTKPDLYSSDELFGRRVFISYERSSYWLAKKLDSALRDEGLEPYSYEPGKSVSEDKRRYTLKDFRTTSPEVGGDVFRTIRRSSAAIFVLSDAAAHSPMCEAEAFAAVMMFQPFCSGIYVVKEKTGLAVPHLIKKVLVREQAYDYEDGVEKIVARDIASRTDRLASFRNTAETLRKERWRKRKAM